MSAHVELRAAELDRVAGALVGLGVGDALGAGYEFGTPPSGDAAFIGGGLGNWAPGEWTDDTSMALCIAEVGATGTLDPLAVAQRFLDWHRTDPADVGIQTRDVLGTSHEAADVPRLAAERFARKPRASAGNGSLMRTAPVALAHLSPRLLLNPRSKRQLRAPNRSSNTRVRDRFVHQVRERRRNLSGWRRSSSMRASRSG